jgi:PTS system nitrogen regulatory IIA component
MGSDDFDVDSLARYLHLTPQQVERLADRARVPGRKVAGKWRFSQGEIHHWLEERIGLLDEDELDQVEGVLKRAATTEDERPISIALMIPPGGIAVPLVARTRGSVINGMAKLAADTGLLWDAKQMSEAVRRREEMQSTALDVGVALLHPRRPLPSILSEAFLVMGRTSQGIPFGGSRAMTDVFFLVCSRDDRGHLRTLARLSRLLSSASFLDEIRAAADAETTRQVIAQTEKDLD